MEDLYNKMIDNPTIVDLSSSVKHRLGFKKEDKKFVNEILKQSFTMFYDQYVLINYSEDDKFYVEDVIDPFDNYLELIMYLIPCFHMLGDTLGYKNGEWEFNFDTPAKEVTASLTSEFIFRFLALGGVNDISLRNWRYSDDSLMYLATLEVANKHSNNLTEFCEALKIAYVNLIPDLETRHPGTTTMQSLLMLRDGTAWNAINYNSMAIGSGTSMRTGCLGIIFCGIRNRRKLMISSIEASRITHNSAIAILGGLTSALFTAYAIEQVPINYWPHYLVEFIRTNEIDDYLKESRPNEYPFYQRDKVIFLSKWEKYLTLRFNGIDKKIDQKSISNPISRIQFLANNFSRIENSFFPGACADDSVIMAYDALLESNGSFEKVIVNSALHPGDSDTVGSIALGWFIGCFFSLKNYSISYRMLVELEKFNYWDDVLKKIMKTQLPLAQNEMYHDIFYIRTMDLVKLTEPYNEFDDLKKLHIIPYPDKKK